MLAAGRYDGPLGQAVVGHKERGRLALARPLGGLLAVAVLATATPEPVLLVPVPSAPRAVRARGQDHALRLATAAARVLRHTGHDVRAVAGLQVIRPVRDQAGLGAAARRANLAGAFAVRRGATGLTRSALVVVDDVMTTGSSLGAAVEAVRRAGGDVAGCAVVAVAGPVRGITPGGGAQGPQALPGSPGLG